MINIVMESEKEEGWPSLHGDGVFCLLAKALVNKVENLGSSLVGVVSGRVGDILSLLL